ncbi:head maturation protease, ClpP-related [Microbacterium sp. cx-55]|uniref:head maturation protease, ClpP-related n=1 Tax=Microbacterium sp. cx-55 TaxID=2875948 RepID=UPI001CC1105E|nr:head maturation protease, ClpP-related [Microbacterium sp. cx-55]MBZ4486276.1 ATP-dependent Clp protease proteolytic subunit [Microbacterium sp. cx-55]
MTEPMPARDKFAALAARTTSTWNVATDADTRRASLHLYGVIGAYWDGIDAAEVVPAIRALDVDTLDLFVNSPGGNVYDGIAIRNALRQHSAHVVVTVDGLAASAASFIACGGDEVVMGENAELMIHDAWGMSIGNAADMRTAADDLDRISDNIAAMYAAKAGGDAADWRALMKAETWYTADEAVAAGLADRLDSDAAADETTSNLFDLSMYAHAGRAAATAPVPVAALATNRKETSDMPELTRDDLDAALAQHQAESTRIIEARLAGISNAAPPSDPTWPSFGAFLKDLVGGSEQAMTFYERMAAYDGSTTADDKQPNTWVRSAIHLIRRTRKIMGKFDILPLPAEGMTLEYLQLESNSIAVAKQAAQGADLVKGKVKLGSKTTPVETYGGWTELTRQQIDRGSAAYISTANTAMTLEYARATEQVVRDLLKAIIAAKIASAATSPLTIAANANAYAWLDLIVDAAGLFDDNSFTLAGGLVSKDVFKRLIRLEDTNGNSLMRVWGEGMNQVGELDLTGIRGNLASVQFEILPGAVNNTIEFHDTLGITTWESPGAPFRLQDAEVVNLTEKVSQYGYLAAASQFVDAIQAVRVTGA